MKRFVLVFALFVTSVAVSNAQYAYPSEITSRGGKIFAYGEKLEPTDAAQLLSEVGGLELGEDYLSYRKGFRTGVGLSVGGAAATVVGTMAFYTGVVFVFAVSVPTSLAGKESPVWPEAVMYAGGAMAVSGAALVVAGIPTACVYRHRIKKVTDEYNSTVTSTPVVTFSPARSGIGIAMNF